MCFILHHFWKEKKRCSSLRLQSIGKKSGAKQTLQFYFPSQPQGRIHIYSWPTFLSTVSCIILVEGCLASKQLPYISHCSVVGRWRATETSSNNWFQLPFVSVIGFSMEQLYPLGRKPMLPSKEPNNENLHRYFPPPGSARIVRTSGKIFSVLECSLTLPLLFPPLLLLFPHVRICYCLGSSFFIAQMEMRWPNG